MDRESDDGRCMTFAELATARGISRASASKLVRRRKWRRQTDNRGTVRILVPAEAMDSPSVSPSARPSDNPSVGPSDSPLDTSRAISALEAALAALDERRVLAEQIALATSGAVHIRLLGGSVLSGIFIGSAHLARWPRWASQPIGTASRCHAG
jgi:hypothetical protein